MWNSKKKMKSSIQLSMCSGAICSHKGKKNKNKVDSDAALLLDVHLILQVFNFRNSAGFQNSSHVTRGLRALHQQI